MQISPIKVLLGSALVISAAPVFYKLLRKFIIIPSWPANLPSSVMTALSTYERFPDHWSYSWVLAFLLGFFSADVMDWLTRRRKSKIDNEIEFLKSLSDEIYALSKDIADNISDAQGFIDRTKIDANGNAMRSRISSLMSALEGLKIPTPNYAKSDETGRSFGYYLYLRDIWPFAQKGQLPELRKFAESEIKEFASERVSQQDILSELMVKL